MKKIILFNAQIVSCEIIFGQSAIVWQKEITHSNFTTQGKQTPTSRKENLEFDYRVW